MVLYVGPSLAGVSTTLSHFVPLDRCRRDGFARRLLDGVHVELAGFSGPVRFLFWDFGNCWVPSLEAGTNHELPFVRESANRLIENLPKISGVVFVVDSHSARLESNQERLEQVGAELSAAGVDIERLPFVFQLNKRDLPAIASVAELSRHLSTPRADYVEAIAILGYGVREALERAITPRSASPIAAGGTDVAVHRSPHHLFGPMASRELTLDGVVRAEVHVSHRTQMLEVGQEIAATWIWPRQRVLQRNALSGIYLIEIARRRILMDGAPQGGELTAAVRARSSAEVVSIELCLVAGGYPFRTIFGAPSAVKGAKQATIPRETYHDAAETGASVALRHGFGWLPRWSVAVKHGNLVLADATALVWFGLASDGAVCEVGALSSTGRALLGEPTWKDGEFIAP